MLRFWFKQILLMVTLGCCFSAYATVKVVAAENMYGELAKQLGGKLVQVTSILNNPNQDPHLFNVSPSVAKKIAEADVIVYNGAGYDTWMDKLVEANQAKQQQVINIANLIGAAPGVNPHLWYQPQTMQTYAKVMADTLSKIDSKNQAYYQQQLAVFQQNYLQLASKMVTLRHKYAGTPVIATEPVFEYMSEALGLKMLGQGFQQSVMNDVEPSPSQLKEVEDLLKTQRVKVLFYNKQVINPLTKQLQALAKQQNIPIVGVTEIQPPGTDYLGWMLEQLNNLDQALHYVDNTAS